MSKYIFILIFLISLIYAQELNLTINNTNNTNSNDTKKPRIKFSRVELLMGRLLVFIFFLQIILCFVCVIMHRHYEKEKTNFLVNFIFPKNRKER